MTPSTANLISRAVRATILQTHSADSCIASVYVLREVLHIGFNLTLHPRAVSATIYNRYVTREILANRITTPEGIIAGVRSPQGWSVGVGHGGQAATDASKWAGHLVGITKHPKGYLLWDPSFDQASRPHKDMPLRPFVHLLEHDVYNLPETRLVLQDCFTVYVPKPDAEEVLKHSPDWANGKRFEEHIVRVLDLLNDAGLRMGGQHER